MSYKTLDGYELNEGEECFVSYSCHTGEIHLSQAPRPAYYMDVTCKANGWEFCLKKAKRSQKGCCDDCACEVVGVWKKEPVNQEGNR